VQIEIAATITPPPLSEPVRKIMLNLSLFVKSRDEVLATAKLKMPKNYMNKYECHVTQPMEVHEPSAAADGWAVL
jgi:hypothetical protein